jgi:hypothetical protein
MKKLVILIAALIITLTAVFGQEKPELVTDRPDQTEAPSIVPAGGVQVETGFIYEKDGDQNFSNTNLTYNTTLLKYGVSDHFELRFITEYLGERTKASETTSIVNGFSPLAIGVKIKLADQTGFWPQAALIGHINLKSGSKEFAPSYTAADFRFTLAHTLSDRFSLSYNIGAEWNGETPEATFLYTLALGYTINSRAALFVESYSFFAEKGKADNRADAGFTYKFTPVVQWDISAGVGLSENAPDTFLSTGISFRMFK